MDPQVPPHFHKEDRISETDLIPDGAIYSALPTTGPEGARATVWDGSTATFYRMVQGAWRQVGGAPAGAISHTAQYNNGGVFGGSSNVLIDYYNTGIALNHGSAADPPLLFGTDAGIYGGTGQILFTNLSSAIASFTASGASAAGYGITNVTEALAGGLQLGLVGNIAWSDSTAILPAHANDVNISRYAAGKLAVGNGTQGNASGTLLAALFQGVFQPNSLADASAANNSIYYSTTQSKLVYKDSGGTVNNLY